MTLRLGKHAYDLNAVIDAGVSPTVAKTLLADDPDGRIERPLLQVGGRRRGEPTTRYIWGPDAMALLAEYPST